MIVKSAVASWSTLALLSLGVGMSLGLGGCEARVSLGGRCVADTDCNAPYRCLGKICREECRSADECPSGLRCVAGQRGIRACTQPIEERCDGTDPCDEELFAACREGRCVTACSNETDCVAGSCEVTGTLGVCIEPVSTGGQDAAVDGGASTDAARADADLSACTGSATPLSPRSLGVAVLEDTTVARSAHSALQPATPPMTVDATTRFAIGLDVRDEGQLLWVGVRHGERDLGTVEIELFQSHPFVPTAATPDGRLAAAIGLGDIAIDVEYDAVSTETALLVVTRPTLTPTDSVFAWVQPSGSAAVPLYADPSRRYPGGLAFLAGPEVGGAERVFGVHFRDGTQSYLGLVGTYYSPDNTADLALPASWGVGALALAGAPHALLAYDPNIGEALLVRVFGTAVGRALDATSAPVTLRTGIAPALVAIEAPSRYLAVTQPPDCAGATLVPILCTSREACAAEADTSWLLSDERALQLEAHTWGSATTIAMRTDGGATVLLLDQEGHLVPEALSLVLANQEGSRTLREIHVSADTHGRVAAVALCGLYVASDGVDGQVLCRATRYSP